MAGRCSARSTSPRARSSATPHGPYTVGNKAPYTPDYTVNIGTQVTLPVTNTIDANFRADYRITGPTYFHTVQANSVPNFFFGSNVLQGNFAKSRRNSFDTLNLRASLQGRNWSATAFGTNVLNRKFLAEVIAAPEFGGDFVSPGARATYGIELGFKF